MAIDRKGYTVFHWYHNREVYHIIFLVAVNVSHYHFVSVLTILLMLRKNTTQYSKPRSPGKHLVFPLISC
ncbi:MAG: hypothetical protein LBT95_05140 [Treponema sp.]|nr:hypothetical protein [Treponema sp.]